jgi:Spy/CpxP family protein refolding chaperone
MKHLILACSLASVISLAHAAELAKPPASASVEGHRHSAMQCHSIKTPAERAAHMKQKLGLSDDQTNKVQKIFEQRKQQRDALHEKYKPQLEAYYADKKKLREQTHADIASVLTPAQKEKLKDVHEGGHHQHSSTAN